MSAIHYPETAGERYGTGGHSPDGKTCPSCWWHSGTLSRMVCLEHIQGIQLPYVPLRSRIFWSILHSAGESNYLVKQNISSLYLCVLRFISCGNCSRFFFYKSALYWGGRGVRVCLCLAGGSERQHGTAWSQCAAVWGWQRAEVLANLGKLIQSLYSH